MNCHYSCSACSANIYYDLCTSCPSTRTLTLNACPCSTGYIEIKSQQCIPSASASTLDSLLINISQVIFFVAIGLHLLSIVLMLNRLASPSLKKIVDTFQVIGIVSYYRFLQSEVATQGLRVMNAFNFNYLTSLICTKQIAPYGCTTFQNLFGPMFSLLFFMLLFFLSYFIAYCMYAANTQQNEDVIYIRNGKQQKGLSKTNQLSFTNYWHSTKKTLIFLYLDHTAVQSAVVISQIAIANYFGALIIAPFLLFVGSAVRLHFSTINHASQTTLAYRTKHFYFYLYDQCYHFNYIDHIFAQQNLSKGNKLTKPFYPQSNLMIIEVLFKILLAVSSIVFYQYQPYLFAYLSITLLCIYFLNMRNFFYYQRSTLLFYFLAVAAHAFAVSTFFLQTFFTYFVSTLSIVGLLLMIIIVIFVIRDWKSSREGEMIKKMYELQVSTNKISNAQDSEEELIKDNRKQMHVIDDPLQNALFYNNEVDPLKNPENSLPKQSRGIQRKTIGDNLINNKLTTKEISVRESPALLMTRRTTKNQQKQQSIGNNPLLQAVTQNAKQPFKNNLLSTSFQKNEQGASDRKVNPLVETKLSQKSRGASNAGKRLSVQNLQKGEKEMPQIQEQHQSVHNGSKTKLPEARKTNSKAENIFQNLEGHESG